MSSTAGADDGEDDIVAALMRDFPAPLNQMLVRLYHRNRETWLSGVMKDTLEAVWVRDTGLTPWQMDRATAIAEMMGGDHPAFVEDPAAEADVDAEEIVSDTSVEDLLGGDLR